jgi:hypothetical protein
MSMLYLGQCHSYQHKLIAINSFQARVKLLHNGLTLVHSVLFCFFIGLCSKLWHIEYQKRSE